MSKKAKGDRRERQCASILFKSGWEAHKKVNNRYDSGDIFGIFDIIAVKKGEKPLFIQVKSNRTSGALKEINVKNFVDTETMNVQVWVAHDNEGWRIKKLEDDGWTQILDERDRSCNFGEATVELFSS